MFSKKEGTRRVFRVEFSTAVNESVFKWIFIGLLSWGKSIMVVKGEHHLRVVSLLMPKKFVCFASYYGLIMLWHLNSFFKLIKHKFGEAPPVPNL
jgi:hypothetical protein